MNRLAIALCLALALPAAGATENKSVTAQDNAVLKEMLGNAFFGSDNYTIVVPVAELPASVTRKFLMRKLGSKGEGVPQLIEQFLLKNRKPTRLTLKSATDYGYVIDYDGSYRKHFASPSCKKWVKQHPKVHGLTTVSLPAHIDKYSETMIFIRTTFPCGNGTTKSYVWLIGEGDGTLEDYGKAAVP